jgi:hypothetical protein
MVLDQSWVDGRVGTFSISQLQSFKNLDRRGKRLGWTGESRLANGNAAPQAPTPLTLLPGQRQRLGQSIQQQQQQSFKYSGASH